MNEPDDKRFLLRALALAKESVHSDGGPFGAIVVRDGEVIGEGTNRVTSTYDPTAHAEVVAVRAACRHLADFDLSGSVVYASCEPCPMCLGAILWARCERIVFAAGRDEAAAAGFDDAEFYREIDAAPEARRVERRRLVLPESAEVFAAWQAKTDKIVY